MRITSVVQARSRHWRFRAGATCQTRFVSTRSIVSRVVAWFTPVLRPPLDWKRLEHAHYNAHQRQPYRSRYNGATDLRAAANFVVPGKCRSVARAMGIPESTLRGVVRKGVAEKMGRKPLLLPHEEARLYQAMIDRAIANMPMPKYVAGVIASEIIRLRDVGFATEDGLPSDGWWRLFLDRHTDISFRAGSRLKAGYFLAFNTETVEQFFALVERLMTTYNFPPECMVNGDESQVPTRSGEKLLAPKFFRRVRALDVDKHAHVSILPFITAAGQALPCLIFVFKGKVACREMLGDRFLDAAVLTTGKFTCFAFALPFVAETGYIRGGSFLLALMHLDRYLPPLDRRPVLLFLDQLQGHMTLEVSSWLCDVCFDVCGDICVLIACLFCQGD
jgi:hypothetical protein